MDKGLHGTIKISCQKKHRFHDKGTKLLNNVGEANYSRNDLLLCGNGTRPPANFQLPTSTLQKRVAKTSFWRWLGYVYRCLLRSSFVASRSIDHRTRSAIKPAKGAMSMSMLARSSAPR